MGGHSSYINHSLKKQWTMSQLIEIRSIIAENVIATHTQPLKYKPDFSYMQERELLI